MAKFRFLQNSFRSGEVGPKLKARTDSKQYQEACEELLNMVPMKQGGVTGRMGSIHVKTTVLNPTIIPFVFSKDESFAILIHSYGQPTVIDQDGVDQAKTSSGVGIAGITAYGALGFAHRLDPDGFHYTQSGDIVVIVHNQGEYAPVVVKRIEDGSFVFEYYSIGEDFNSLRDKREVLRWPYQNINIDEKWLEFRNELSIVGPITAKTYDIVARSTNSDTAGAPDGPLITDFWKNGEIGSLIRIAPYSAAAPNNIELVLRVEHMIVEATGTIDDSLVESSVARCRLISQETSGLTMSDINHLTKDWKKSFWSGYNGYPRTVSQYESRLFFGGNRQFPDTVWGSKSLNIFHIMQERLDQDKNAADKTEDVSGLDFWGVESASDPMSVVPAATEVNKIQWMASANGLVIGTLGAEYVMTGGSQGLTNDNVIFARQSSTGSSNVMPALINNTIYYVSRSGTSLYSILVDPVQQVAQILDTSIVNESIVNHLSDDSQKIVRLAPQVSSETVWCLTSGKSLIGFTREQLSDVAGWHRHTIGGPHQGIESIGIVPNGSGRWDDLWISAAFTGVGIYMQGCDLADPGADSADFGTGFLFFDFAPEDTATAVDTLNRRLAIKVPTTTVGSDLSAGAAVEGLYFTMENQNGVIVVWYKVAGEIVPTVGGAIEFIPVSLDPADDYMEIVNKTAAAIGGASEPLVVDGTYETIQCIGEPFDHDRTFNSSSVGADKPYFMDDCILSTTFPTATTVSGFDHLARETVQVIADGFYAGEKTVDDNGIITLDNEASEVIAGYSYTCRLKTFPIEVGGDYGSAVGVIQRIDKISMFLYKTFGITAGYEELEELELIPEDFELVGSPPTLPYLPLFTGRYHLDFPASPDDEQYVIIEQEKPYPVTILGISMRGVTYDRSQ